MKKFYFLTLLTLLIIGCKNDAKDESANQDQAATSAASSADESITKQIAMANGYENFKDVKQLNFTFNVKVNDTVRSQRAWKWYPQEERVELIEKEQTSTYVNDGDLTDEEKAIDQKFINDSYWLLFPYQLEWSEYTVEHSQNAEAPISKDTMEQVSIIYATEGGYTPGDTYHLFLNDDKIIQEWTYVSSTGRTMATTWEDYEEIQGLNLAKMHKSEDGSFQLYFTDLEVIK